jgi:hypothetical protein
LTHGHDNSFASGSITSSVRSLPDFVSAAGRNRDITSGELARTVNAIRRLICVMNGSA